jgi:imidazolonepropionase-like amidohydrolase
VGIAEEIYREEGADANEITDPVTPHLRAIDAINPADLAFGDALSGGVTTEHLKKSSCWEAVYNLYLAPILGGRQIIALRLY